jgi:hypothetical protein
MGKHFDSIESVSNVLPFQTSEVKLATVNESRPNPCKKQTKKILPSLQTESAHQSESPKPNIGNINLTGHSRDTFTFAERPIVANKSPKIENCEPISPHLSTVKLSPLIHRCSPLSDSLELSSTNTTDKISRVTLVQCLHRSLLSEFEKSSLPKADGCTGSSLHSTLVAVSSPCSGQSADRSKQRKRQRKPQSKLTKCQRSPTVHLTGLLDQAVSSER